MRWLRYHLKTMWFGVLFFPGYVAGYLTYITREAFATGHSVASRNLDKHVDEFIEREGI